MNLDELAKQHGTDKSTDFHGYTRWYQRDLAHLVGTKPTVLELGWGGPPDSGRGGSSAMMWRDWFENATVICIDNVAKDIRPEHHGIHFRQGDQADPDFLDSLRDEFGDFDLIVDDASHLSSLTIASFRHLWPMLKPGGTYAVEDVHQSYHAHYYGNREANPDPMRPTSTNTETAMQFLKRLADDAQYREDGWQYATKYWRGYDVESVAFMFDLVMVTKKP